METTKKTFFFFRIENFTQIQICWHQWHWEWLQVQLEVCSLTTTKNVKQQKKKIQMNKQNSRIFP